MTHGPRAIARHAPPARRATALLPIVVGLVAAGLSGCSKGGPARHGHKGPLPVDAMVLTPEKVDRIVEVTGTLGGAEEITVSAQVDGRVERVLADLGDRVKKGAPIVKLDSSELRFAVAQAESQFLQSLATLGVDAAGLDQVDPESQADVRVAQADLAEAERNLSRGQELMSRGLLAKGELDTLKTRERVASAALQKALEEARSSFAVAKGRRAALGLARKKLRDATIRSPVTGAIAKRMVSRGEYVKEGQAVAVVVITDPLKMHGEVPALYAGQLRKGMPVEVQLDLQDTVIHRGEVSRIGPLVSSTSHTFPVEALFPNEDGSLKPGLFARARIRIGTEDEVYAIPETAVSSLAGVNKVFVVEDGKARVRPVRVLRKRGSDALVQGKLEPGEQVVLTGIARMFDGAEVRVKTKAEAEADATAAKSKAAGPAKAPGEAGAGKAKGGTGGGSSGSGT